MIVIRNRWRLLLHGVLKPLLLGWIGSAWLAVLMPKRRRRMLFIGRDGAFADNAKYLYLYAAANSNGWEVAFWVESEGLARELDEHRLPYVRSGTLKGLFYLLTTARVVVDNVPWIRDQKYHCLLGARVYQLWHGCPLKKIELDDDSELGPHVPWLFRAYQWARGRYPSYYLVLSPSRLFSRLAFSAAFKHQRLLEEDYPRNAPFHGTSLLGAAVGVDRSVVERLEEAKAAGGKVVFYMPTFRAYAGHAQLDEVIDFDALEAWAERRDVWVVFKLHPFARGSGGPRGRRMIEYGTHHDVYPALCLADVLVTDYSSVFFDFLHLNRPVLFFPYDLERYLKDDRRMYVDFQEMTPGAMCFTFAELMAELERVLDGVDDYRQARLRVRGEAFASSDGGALERIWSVIGEEA